MEHTKEEILNALHIIRDECIKNTNCERCPFRLESHRCYIQNIRPNVWKIKRNDNWRAFE
jgi:hypothetical protein